MIPAKRLAKGYFKDPDGKQWFVIVISIFLIGLFLLLSIGIFRMIIQ